jgi:acetyl esterase/lipase
MFREENMSTSFLYKIVETAVRLEGHRKLFSLGPDGLAAFLKRAEHTRKIRPPARIGKKFRLSEENFPGNRPCYVISPRDGSPSDRAVLFLHGGGFVMEAHWLHWRAVSKLVERLGITLWFPAYPLIPPVRDVREITESGIAVYKKMLETYSPEQITFLGDSAGAALSLQICHHCKTLKLPMPAKLILISPAMIVEQDKDILEAMRRIEPHDVMLALEFMFSMISLFDLDLSRDNYHNAPLYGDFTGFPAMYVFSGTSEIFYPQMQPFVERVRAAGVPVEFYPGEGMMHIWPYMPLARESREALERIMGII